MLLATRDITIKALDCIQQKPVRLHRKVSLPQTFAPFFLSKRWTAQAAPIREGVVTCVGVHLSENFVDCCRILRTHTSASEQQRAAHFFHPADAARHLLGRALLRSLLAREIGASALPATFPCNHWGKPGLPGSGFEFSISHAGHAVWLAITRQIPLGIDVETVNACDDPFLLAEALHPDEKREIRHCGTKTQASQHFLRCWTRKEAVIKALSLGVSCPLDSFRVATNEQTSHWLLHAPPDYNGPWTCQDLACPNGFHVSLAAMAANLTITCHFPGIS